MRNAVFIHIPKCGGTTLRYTLGGYGPPPLGVFYDKAYKSIRKFKQNKFTKTTDTGSLQLHPSVRIVFGHFTIHKWKHLGWPFMTMIRDPVERVISQYSVWSNKKKIEFKGTQGLLGIKDFALDTSNQMSAMMGRDLDLFSFIGILEMFEKSVERLGEIFEVKLPKMRKKYNRTPRRLKITEEEREYVESVNQEDRKIYNEVLRGFK